MSILTSIKKRFEDEIDLLELPIMTSIIFVTVAITLTIGSVYFLSKKECESKAFILSTESSYGLFQGCFIKYDGKWIDYDRYITIKK